MKRLITIGLALALVGIGFVATRTAAAETTTEDQCTNAKFHDFYVGTVTTYCEPTPGTIIVYAHTYTNGFTIFDPDGDGTVDRYCNRNRCVDREDIPSLEPAWRLPETSFFASWDAVLRSLPDAVLRDRGEEPFFAVRPQVRGHEPCALPVSAGIELARTDW